MVNIQKGLKIIRGLVVFFALHTSLPSTAQDYYYRFEGTGASSSVSSVRVRNLSSGEVLTLFGNGILHLTDEVPLSTDRNKSLIIYPNPVGTDNAVLGIHPPVSGNAVISIFDLTGKPGSRIQVYLGNFTQKFRLSGLGNGFYIVNVTGNGYHFSAKIIWNVQSDGPVSLVKISDDNPVEEYLPGETGSGIGDTIAMPYKYGERLMFKGISGNYSTIVMDIPSGDKIMTFPFYRCSDADDNNYTVVQIGTQVWMAENLATTRFSDGTGLLYAGMDDSVWNNDTTGAYSWYNNELTFKSLYGALYNWYSVRTGFLCPGGWHIPSDREWMELIDYLGGAEETGGKIKESGTDYWQSPNDKSTNESGFSALPGGIRELSGFSEIKLGGYWWSSTFLNNWRKPSEWSVIYNSGKFAGNKAASANDGYSVRCVLGPSVVSMPFVSTGEINDISTTSAVASGLVISNEGGEITGSGICWDTSENPGLEDQKTTDAASGDIITIQLTGLKPGTSYHIRAYATNNAGTGFGEDVVFTTRVALPVLTTSPATGIGQSTVTSGGEITDNGGGLIKASGLCWAVHSDPVIGDNLLTLSPGAGSFTGEITGLQPGITYHIRAWATNDAGTAYGEDEVFTTQAILAVIKTATVSDVTRSSASSGGNISYDGGGNITTRGVCWSLTPSPTIMDLKTSNGAGSGSFNSVIDGLLPGTTYHIRAYATNSAGTAYGDDLTFTTLVALPTIVTSSVTGITETSASSGGNITNNGGGSISSRGICWSTAQNPTTADAVTSNGTGSGSFTSSLSGLQPGVTYYVRAWATNSAGTAYGNNISFSTNIALPVITTTGATGITRTSVSTGGNITSSGGGNITSRGVCWALTANPTVNNSRTANGSGTGVFSATVTDLQPGTSYHLRAFATNSAGTSYGEDISFITLVALPELTTLPAGSIRQTTASSGGNITYNGGGTITERGVCWSTSSSPDIGDARTSDGTGTGNFVSAVTGLSPATTYHVRAYATNSAGTAYGQDLSFTTLTEFAVLTTSSITGLTETEAVSGGNITEDGGRTITERGTCWATTPNPTTSNSRTTDGSGTGSFVSHLSGLHPGTTYHIRAYATNGAGTSYGNELTVTTKAFLPSLITSAVSNTGETSATSGGSITDDGGGPVTARGVCWALIANPTIIDSKTSNGTGTGSFTSNITGLRPGTTYHIRAYATNSTGTAYGEDLAFTTQVALPSLTTSAAASIRQTTVTSGGNITSDGGGTITERGVCWANSLNPTTLSARTSDGGGSGSFTSGLTDLLPGTLYHARAYAINGAGTAYGNDITFTTLTEMPVVVTLAVSNITRNSASSGGNVTDDGGRAVTKRGICWATSANPLITDSITSDGSGTGSFASSLTSLQEGTSYHVRAYATNSAGTSYGADLSFSTLADFPVLTTTPVSNLTYNSVVSGGNITSDGGGNITARGVCWALTPSPSVSDSKTSNGTGSGGFSSVLSGLNPGTTYYLRAYATNSAGTSYGDELQIRTLVTLPSLITSAVSNITQTTASSGGTITSDGGDMITERGICWSATTNPDITGNKTSDGSGPGTFSSSLTGLLPGSVYYLRAYATNSTGTAYGPQVSFSTVPLGPPIVEFTASGNGLLLHSLGSKKIILQTVGGYDYIRFSSDNGATYNTGVRVSGIFTASNKARILANGNIVLFCINKLYYSDDNMTTIRSCNVLDKYGNTYSLHTPVNSSYPGGYFNFMGGFAEYSGVCLLGNYANSASGASPVNLYSSLDGITWKVIYTFGQNPNRTDNGTPSGGTGGTPLGDPSNSLITRHIHAINVGDDGNFYACTGDVSNEMHFLKCIYNRSNDTWSISDLLTGNSRSWQRMRALGVFERNGYYYWGSDGPGTFQYQGQVYECYGIYKCPVADINDPSRHILLQSLSDACYSFVNAGHTVFAGLQSYGYIYISFDYGETWYSYEKPAWLSGTVEAVWFNELHKYFGADEGEMISSDSF